MIRIVGLQYLCPVLERFSMGEITINITINYVGLDGEVHRGTTKRDMYISPGFKNPENGEYYGEEFLRNGKKKIRIISKEDFLASHGESLGLRDKDQNRGTASQDIPDKGVKTTTAITITGIAAAWGLIAGNPFLWLPITGLFAGVIDLFTRGWVQSPKLGKWNKFSLYLKLVLTLIGTYAMLSQFACVFLMIYWILT